MWMSRRLLQASSLLAASCSSPTPAADQSDRPFKIAEVTKFDTPFAMEFLPGQESMALITEKEGKMWLVDAATGQRQTVVGVPKVHFEQQGGLLDVIASPDFATTGKIYFGFAIDDRRGSATEIDSARLVLGDGPPRIEDRKRLWIAQPGAKEPAHYAGRLALSPDGQYLFISFGERYQFMPAQALDNSIGKVLRLKTDGGVPTDNPFSGQAGKVSAIWSYGHRNPLGIAFAPDGRLWEIEMGPMGGDEVNLIQPGRNYGWPKASNGSNYDGTDIPDHRPGDGFEAPKVWWNPSVSPAGLLIYTGDLFPQWKGDALLGALSGEAFIRVDLDGDQASKADEWPMGARIRAVDQGPDGAVYLLQDGDSGGKLLRLTPAK